MNPIFTDLHRFGSYAAPIDLTFNQYLLLIDDPILIHTGSKQQAIELIPKLREVLGERALRYIFVSHFESDECGGLGEVLAAYPEAKVLCSQVTARQLQGFGLPGDTLPQKGGDTLTVGGSALSFVTYPSEMHLWDGLLMVERERGILFSSDLVFRLGRAEEGVIDGSFEEEIRGITHEQVPDPEKRRKLQQTLGAFPVHFIAAGHGPCVKVR